MQLNKPTETVEEALRKANGHSARRKPISKINPHNDDEVREMNRKELVAMVQDASTPAAVRLACIKELGDRIDGRAAPAAPQAPSGELKIKWED